jgi:hypothetical protein
MQLFRSQLLLRLLLLLSASVRLSAASCARLLAVLLLLAGVAICRGPSALPCCCCCCSPVSWYVWSAAAAFTAAATLTHFARTLLLQERSTRQQQAKGNGMCQPDEHDDACLRHSTVPTSCHMTMCGAERIEDMHAYLHFFLLHISFLLKHPLTSTFTTSYLTACYASETCWIPVSLTASPPSSSLLLNIPSLLLQHV